ncbi:MAG: PAS domain-containing sensor histidine kinase [Alphaproteobacteria bacterium]
MTATTPDQPDLQDQSRPGLFARFFGWYDKSGLGNRLAAVLAIACIIALGTTWHLVRNPEARGDNKDLIFWMLNVDLVVIMLFAVVITERLVRLFVLRRRKRAGSRLHLRLVAVFAMMAAWPAILMALFSAVFFHVGVQGWFSDRVQTAISGSMVVAERYLEEHKKAVELDAVQTARYLNTEAPLLIANPTRFNRVLEAQAAFRNLTEAVVMDSRGNFMARAGFTLSLATEPISPASIERAKAGDTVTLTSPSEDRVRTLIRLDRFPDAYLVVGRFVDPQVLQFRETVTEASTEYLALEGKRENIQITLTFIFSLITLMLLLAAVAIALNVATGLAQPVVALITAAEKLRAGDLSARVPEVAEQNDEIATLSRVFNRMAGQLEQQRTDLVAANELINERRRVTEAILSGVSAGVLALDAEMHIVQANHRAADLLESGPEMLDKPLLDVLPQAAPVLDGPAGVEAQIELPRPGRPTRLLMARLVREGEGKGAVLTFDDVTELVGAQRKAAWSGVARRIAHEIKNPLTPIQLSAERLKRKYLKQIEDDPTTFELCTDTIVRQVGTIGRMVEEFSTFARMPEPQTSPQDLRPLLREAALLHDTSGAKLSVDLPDDPIIARADATLVTQALTNLLRNAQDAVAESEKQTITLSLTTTKTEAIITVRDSGPGFPEHLIDRITEPYVTTKSTGTGLGLAIVKKIAEDHGGQFIIRNSDSGDGAVTELHLLLAE